MNYQSKKNLKIRSWAFSFFDGVFISTGCILIAGLIIYPFLNYNNQAVVYLIQKKHKKAERKWREALSQDPFSPLYRLNLALNYQVNEQISQALQEYQVTQNFLHPKNESSIPLLKKGTLTDIQTILFFRFFNSAVAETQKNHVPQALRFYQEALAFQPQSLAVKTNIELLTKNRENNKNQNSADKKNQGDSHKNKSSSQREKSHKGEKTKGANQEQEQDNGPSDQKNSKKETQKEGTTPKENPQENPQENQEQKPAKADKPENQKAGSQNQDGSMQKSVNGQDEQKGGSDSRDRKQDQKLGSAQTEAILKAITEQEKQIKKRRQKKRKNPSPKAKDW